MAVAWRTARLLTSGRTIACPWFFRSSASSLTPPLRCLRTTPARNFRLSLPQAAPPIVVVIAAKQAAKLVSILTARFARNRYRRWSKEERAEFWRRVGRHKLKFLFLTSIPLSLAIGYGITHVEKTPYTKRWRFRALTQSQSNELAEMELANQMAQHGPNLLDHDSRVYRNVKTIVDEIIKSNSDVPTIKNVDWKLHVVDRKDIQNAFVLATGDIFVCTGILKMLQNNDEIACVLGHELAHRVLGHDVENLSRGHLIDILFIAMAAILWLVLPSDLIAIVTQSISEKLLRVVLDLPFSRKMEEEADLVGLELTAKACYDVRVSSNIWTMMYLNNKMSENSTADDPYEKYFMTHPLDIERAEKLDANIPSALHIRKSCTCPPLPHEDPRSCLRLTRAFVDQLEDEELERLRQTKDLGEKAAVIRELVETKHAEKVLEEKEKEVAAIEEMKRTQVEKAKAELMEKEKAELIAKERAMAEKNEVEKGHAQVVEVPVVEDAVKL